MLEACANGSSTIAFKHDLLVIVFNRTHKYPKGPNTTPQIQKQAKTLVGWDGAVLFSVINGQMAIRSYLRNWRETVHGRLLMKVMVVFLVRWMGTGPFLFQWLSLFSSGFDVCFWILGIWA